MSDSILTLKQYIAKQREATCDEHNVPMAEVKRLYPDHSFVSAWWKYVVDAFEAGQDFTPQATAGLSQAQLRDLSRTARGLRQGLPMHYLMAGNRRAIAA